MPTHKVNVKWGRELYKDIEINTDDEPLVFKAQLYALTGVLPERQKVMYKGTVIRDGSWGKIPISDSCTILLMGSKEEDVPIEPPVVPLFLEDLNVSNVTNFHTPSGLANLGNTCYMNATVQCLKTVPELRECLKSFTGGISGTGAMIPAQSVTAALRDLYELMDKNIASIPPIMLLQVLQMAFPRFADKNEYGTFVQQDANECWTEIIRMLQQKLLPVAAPGVSCKTKCFVDQYFGGTFEVELKCEESEEEPVSKFEESFLQLSCFISQEVKYMNTGLKSKLQEKITKFSQCLNRDAIFTKTSKIKRLPAYLTIQFVRFYYKEKESINAKILKEVKFPMDFDAYDLCTPELQQMLTPMRQKFKEEEDRAVSEAHSQSQLQPGQLESPNSLNGNKNSSNTTEFSTVAEKAKLFSFQSDHGSNNSGYYRLQAVLTHRGRSSSSGHYVAWIKHTEKSWMKCDDDVVSPVNPEDVLKLCGGGDWHCAYVLLYGPRILEDTSSNQEKL